MSIINAQRIPALQQDRVDVAASGMTRADNRRRDIDFSLAYLISPHKVLVRRDSGIVAVKQLAGRRLALVRSASVDAELKEAVPTHGDRPLRRLRRVLQGARSERGRRASWPTRCCWRRSPRRAAPPQDYTFVPGYDLPRTAGFGLKKDEPRWTAFVDETLLALETSGEAQRIFDAWFEPVRRPFHIQRD